MGKSKKLLSFKRYLVKGAKNNLLENKITGEKFLVQGNEISFYTSRKEINKLNHNQQDDIIIVDRYQYFIKEYLFKHLIGIIGLILIIIIMATSNYYIREIVFQDEKMASADVYQTVSSYLKKYGPFQVLSCDISEISKDLRQKYYYYAWIGLSKSGGKLIIEIECQDVPSLPDDDKTVGDLTACCDGIVKAIYIKAGIVLVSINQAVKKGDIIVTGNLRHLNNENNLKDWTRASGVIIAKTLFLEKIKIPKKQVQIEYTGRVEIKTELLLFKKPVFNINTSFLDYHKRIETSFGINNLFKLSRIAYYERAEITTINDEGMIETYTKNFIINQFEKNRTHPKEQITLTQIVEIIEEEKDFVVKVIVGAEKNIASFEAVK